MRSPVRIWIAAPAQDTSKPEGFGVFLFCGRGCKASPLGRGVCEADGEGKPGRIELRYSDKQALCQSGAIVVYVILRQRPCPLRRFAPRPGCGTQRLLRCRLHPAGRCPNSSSLFPPLAAVVAVAPKGRGTGVPVRPTRDEQSLIFSETVVPCYRGQALPVCKLSAHRLTFAGKGV